MKKSIMLLSVVLIATLITACHIDEAAEYTVNPILTLEDEDAVKAKLNEITADDMHIYIPFQGYDPEFEKQRPQDGG